MIRFLSSLRFMVMVSASLIVLLLTGILLGRLDSWRMVMRSPFSEVSLNRRMLIDWLAEKSPDSPTVGVWLILAGVLGVFLFVNLALACGTTLWRIWKARRDAERGLLLGIHLAFVVTLACHGLALVWGSKASARLSEGESLRLTDGRIAVVEKLNFASDTALLTKSRHDRTSDVYDWDGNFIVLRVGDEILTSVRHMFPAQDSAGYQYSLPMFMDAARPMGEGHGAGHGEGQAVSGTASAGGMGMKKAQGQPVSKPAALVVATRHHVDTLFFLSFALVLATMAGYTVLTWRKGLALQQAEINPNPQS